MRRVVRFACVIALIAVGAWLWLSTEEAAAPVVDPAHAASTSNEASDQSSVAPRLDATTETTPIAESSREQAPADVAADSADKTTQRTFTTRVVDAESKLPIAGARVWIVPRDRLIDPRWPELGTLVSDPMTILETEPPLGTSGADGSIDVTVPEVRSVLAASTPRGFGALVIAQRTQRPPLSDCPPVMPFYADATVRVEVVDDAGTLRPFVPIECATRGGPKSTGVSPPILGNVQVRDVAEPGTTAVTIPHARWRMHGSGEPAFDAITHTVVRPVIGFLSDNLEVVLEDRHFAGETVRIVVPPCAPIRVRLLQSDGTPWPFEGVVSTKDEVVLRVGGLGNAPLRGGDALFDALLVEPAFEAKVRARDPRFPALDVRHPGNRVPWVETLLTATLPKPEDATPTLAGRVLNADGTPAADTEFFVMFTRPSGIFGEPRRFRTRSDGRFEAPFADARPPARRALFRTDRSKSVGALDPREWAPFDLPDPLTLGKHELGDLRLRATHVIVGGRAQTSDGTPVVDAGVTAVVADDASQPDPIAGPYGVLAPGTTRELRVNTQSDGSFRIYGPEENGTVRVTASWRTSVLPPVDVASGRADVVLEFPRLAWVRGRVLCDARVLPTLLHVDVSYDTRLTGAQPAQRVASCLPLGDGTFALEVESGQAVRLSVWARTRPDSLIKVDDVKSTEAPIGESFVASDPRLDPIDIRGRVRAVRGLVLDADEQPISQATIRSESGGNSIQADHEGHFTWLTTDAAPVLVVSWWTMRPVRVTADVDDVVVHLLEFATPLIVHLPDKLVVDGLLVVRAWVEDPSLPEKQRLVHEADFVKGVATLYVAKPGKYVVRFVAAQTYGLRKPIPDVAVPVDVTDSTPIEITLPVTQAQVDAAAKAATGK